MTEITCAIVIMGRFLRIGSEDSQLIVRIFKMKLYQSCWTTGKLTHGGVDGPLVGVGGERVDRLLVGRLEGPHVVEERGGHVGVLHQVEIRAGVEGQEALQVRDQPA